MKEIPMLFNTDMVKAILEGRKTQTRRVIDVRKSAKRIPEEVKPPCQPGDVIWVRETWCQLGKWDCDGVTPGTLKYYYAADSELPYDEFYYDGEEEARPFPKWSPSIHMPRSAARLFLKVKNVRVERIQDITEEDAKAEGIAKLFDHMSPEEFETWANNVKCMGFDVEPQKEQPWKNYLWHGNVDAPRKLVDEWTYQYSGYKSARDSFFSLWELIYQNFQENPFVWVIEFERMNNYGQ